MTDKRDLAGLLGSVGAEWRTVAVGASRWYARNLRARYPHYEFEHQRHGDTWTITARRRA